MRLQRILVTATVALVALAGAPSAKSVSGIHRQLRRMVGYTIIATDSVQDVMEGRYGAREIRLLSGARYKIDLGMVPPLVMSDVVVFAKTLQAEPAKAGQDAPERRFYSYMLLVDDEVLDVSPITR